MRILHTADLHLGSPLIGVSDRLRLAADGVLRRIVDTALAEKVDALVIAGDMLDRKVADLSLRARLVQHLSRAVRGGVPVVLIKGNHDALMDYDGPAALGDGIHLLTRETPSATIGDAVFHGVGFEGNFEKQSLLPHYPPPTPGRINIGLMHTSLAGHSGRDPYAPVAPAELLRHGYDYWALGHVHQRSELVQDGVALVMPGIPQGRDAGEPGIGSVTLATLGGQPDLMTVPVADVAFETVTLDASGLDQSALLEAFREAAPIGGPHRMMRYRISGSDMPLSLLQAYAEEALSELDSASLEAIRRVDRPSFADQGLLLSLAAQEAESDSFADEATRLLEELRAALPPAARDALPEHAKGDLIQEAMAELAAALGAARG
jgi:DNA repair exonuclease SbcCD nuclease subunit